MIIRQPRRNLLAALLRGAQFKQGEKRMYGIMALESALAEHEGTFYYVNSREIVSFYRSVEDPAKTVIFMTDKRTYDVKAPPEEIAGALGEVWSW